MRTNRHHTGLALMLCIVVTVPGCLSHAPRSGGATSPPVVLPPGYERSYVVFGKRYFVMSNGTGYEATGTASWYGPKFNGRPTASGEIYDMHQLTAAHKSLPLQTVVEVTNLNNQRSVVVRINDRGPFVGERLIDMSFGAAQALDMIGPGTVPVKVTVLNTPPGPTTAVSTVPAATPPRTDAYIQVGAFADVANARDLAIQLEQSGFSDVSIQEFVLNERTLQRVKIGPLSIAADYQVLLDRLAGMGLGAARIVSP